MIYRFGTTLFLTFAISNLLAATYTVTDPADTDTPGTLRNAINTINLSTDTTNTITIDAGLPSITLASNFPVISTATPNSLVTITGLGTGVGNVTEVNGNSFRIFATNKTSLTLQNITVGNGLALGGTGSIGNLGSGGGGGGLGAGGGVFIDLGQTLTLDSITILGGTAQGGNGGNGGSGGAANGIGGSGGGASWSQGSANPPLTSNIGGGDHPGNNSTGGFPYEGVTGYVGGGAGGSGKTSGGVPENGGSGGGSGMGSNATMLLGGAGGYFGGGGGGGSPLDAGGGGGNGGGAGNFQVDNSFGGGGGGYGSGGAGGLAIGTVGAGGGGGFGGGGGGAGNISLTTGAGGGGGGFGAGGGGGTGNALQVGNGGVGGSFGGAGGVGTTTGGGGGGGAGIGGAVFVSDGATLNILLGNFSGPHNILGNATAGTPGTGGGGGGSGTAYANDIFLFQGAKVVYSLSASRAMNTSILSDQSLSAIIDGGVTINNSNPLAVLTLNSSNPSNYLGGTFINSGILALSDITFIGGSSAGITFGGGTLHATADLTSTGAISVTANSVITTDSTFTTMLSSPGTLTAVGSNTLTLQGLGTNSLSTVVVNNPDVFTIAGPIGGSQLLTKSGAGTLVLPVGNTYTGGTSVSAGILNIQNATALGTISATVVSGAQLQMQGGIAVTNPLGLSGAGVSGTGALLNVQSNNSYSGSITLNADSTIGSATGTLLTLSAISGAHNLTFVGAGNTTVGGIIGTLTALTQNGSGTLILAGMNTYPGTTTINSGIVNIQNATALGNGGTATVAGGAQLQLQGTIVTNANPLILNGAGGDSSGALLNFLQSNTYSGAITLGSDSTIGSATGTLTLNAISGAHNLTFAGAGSTIVNGIIGTGGGSLTKIGAGTVTLNGTNTYAGGTFVNAGTLAITTALNIGGVSANFSLGGGTLHATGVVASSGAVSVTGSSVITSEMTTTLSGTLTGSNGITLTLNGAGTNSLSTVAVNNSDVFTVAGAIGGMQQLTKSGTGALILTGTSTYTGNTQVSQGTLVVNGSTTGSNTTVASGAILKGLGAINNTVTVQSGGTIFPGNSIGPFATGPLFLNAGSITQIEANSAGMSSVINVTGVATLGGILDMIFDPGTYTVGQTFTILTATGGISGTYSATESSIPGLTFETIYNSNSVLVSIGAVPPPPPPPPPPGPPPPPPSPPVPPNPRLFLAGIHGNAGAIGNYLNSINSQAFIQSALKALAKLSPSQLDAALRSISPGRNAFSTYVSQDTMFTVNKVATTRMSIQRSLHAMGNRNPMVAGLYQESRREGENLLAVANDNLPRGSTTKAAANNDEYAIWATGLGDFTHQNKQNQNPAFNATAAGGLLGFETYKFSNVLLGASAGYAHSDIDMDQKSGHADINSYFVGLYETTYIHNGYIELSLWGTYNQFKNKRHITYPGFDATARSSHHGWQVTPSLAVGYDFGFKWGAIEPFAEVDAVINFEQGFSEKKAFPFNMRETSKTSEFLRFETGLNAYETWEKKWGTCILRETLSYVLRKPFHVGTVNAAIVGAPGSFTVYSFTETQNIISPGAEIFIKHKKGGFVSAAYSGEFSFGSGYMSNEIIGKVGVYF